MRLVYTYLCLLKSGYSINLVKAVKKSLPKYLPGNGGVITHYQEGPHPLAMLGSEVRVQRSNTAVYTCIALSQPSSRHSWLLIVLKAEGRLGVRLTTLYRASVRFTAASLTSPLVCSRQGLMKSITPLSVIPPVCIPTSWMNLSSSPMRLLTSLQGAF